MCGAERLWWLLRHFGHDDCAVMELSCWRGPLRSGEEEIEQQEFTPRERTVTSGLRASFKLGVSQSPKSMSLKRRTFHGQLFEQYRVPTQRL